MMGINTPDVSVWEAVLQLDDDYLAPVGQIKKSFIEVITGWCPLI